VLVNNEKKAHHKKTRFYLSPFIHSIFEFVFTVFLSAVASPFEGLAVPLLSTEVVEWTDCKSLGDWGALFCEAASAICAPMIFELACLKWSLNFNCTTLMHMDVSARPNTR
jgi:hypothetical protein